MRPQSPCTYGAYHPTAVGGPGQAGIFAAFGGPGQAGILAAFGSPDAAHFRPGRRRAEYWATSEWPTPHRLGFSSPPMEEEYNERTQQLRSGEERTQ
jgi:hypothetical protein